MSYQFHPEAEAEYLEAVAYYEQRQPGLGASFLAEFESALAQVCESPHRYPIERKPDIRRIRLTRFPFMVLFRESPWPIGHIRAMKRGLPNPSLRARGRWIPACAGMTLRGYHIGFTDH